MSLIPVDPFQRVQVTMGGSLFDPRALPGLQLYFDSRLQATGADQSIVNPLTDFSGKGLNGSHDTSGGNNGEMRLNTVANLSPNGQKTVFFSGADSPHAPVALNALPNPWPTVASGYTFYVVANLQASASSSTLGMLWNEGSAANFRWVYLDTGTKWGYRDQAGAERLSNTGFVAGWQSARLVIHAAGTVDLYVNRAIATWQGGWNQQWTINPAALSGYTLGNLATNYVVGLTGYLGAFLWYGVEHTLAQQTLVENFMRGRFGLA